MFQVGSQGTTVESFQQCSEAATLSDKWQFHPGLGKESALALNDVTANLTSQSTTFMAVRPQIQISSKRLHSHVRTEAFFPSFKQQVASSSPLWATSIDGSHCSQQT